MATTPAERRLEPQERGDDDPVWIQLSGDTTADLQTDKSGATENEVVVVHGPLPAKSGR